ncbi:hypothetical protein HP475_09130 [Serratia marcescens]|uniref:hypothetical protein n=1 Tax=Serratia marcescens TaxID=615 RepID=UPI0015D6B5EF|nr:hypothetical protein [Serratia marcescens]MBH2978501.1 hypothetical protein [Serratia marcescens]MBN5325893.1 hypothetical protein [Serratia marcescens]MBN5347605.1 hypothetical protein [Serratia marcescens]QLJ60085.1 hypothetical protein HP475_09130 [Serratia marcescens]
MTLTTEQLKHILDNPNEFSLSQVQEMAAELLANREAQPVAWRHDNGPFAGMALTRSKSVADSWMANGWNVTPLYTAQSAPTVPDGFKLVPTVPTPEMIAAAMNCDDVTFINLEDFCVNFGNIYAAMLEAATEGRSND